MARQRSPLTVTANPCSVSKKNSSGTKSAANSDSFRVRQVFNVWCVRVFFATNATILFDQNELHLKRYFYFLKLASSVSQSLHAHFLPQQQYSHCFWLFTFRFIDEDASFFHFFPQDKEHMELTVLLFFQNLYAIFAQILQDQHDFQSNVAIFPSIVQAYT